MELYVDEKWRLSKKGGRNNGGSMRRAGEPFTWKGAGTMSMREGRQSSSSSSSSSSSAASAAGRKFSSRCASLVKEQRAKFYIMRRCVTMLICWRDYA